MSTISDKIVGTPVSATTIRSATPNLVIVAIFQMRPSCERTSSPGKCVSSMRACAPEPDLSISLVLIALVRCRCLERVG